MTTPSNFVEIPKTLFLNMLLFINDPGFYSESDRKTLLEDAEQWIPPASDEEIDRSFDANR